MPEATPVKPPRRAKRSSVSETCYLLRGYAQDPIRSPLSTHDISNSKELSCAMHLKTADKDSEAGVGASACGTTW